MKIFISDEFIYFIGRFGMGGWDMKILAPRNQCV